MAENPEGKIQIAVDEWKRFWGQDLESVYLYGSAARDQWSPKSSDINLLLQVTSGNHYRRWAEAASVSKRLFRKGFAVPLILTADYIRSSLDVFPIEFLDIKLFHRVLVGEDLFQSVEISPADLRLQAEREIKGKWVQLRQAGLERGGNTVEMRNLLMMTVPVWVSVFQAMLVIHGDSVPSDKREVLLSGAKLAKLEPEIFLYLEQARREKRSMNRASVEKHLLDILTQVDHLARYVDRGLDGEA